MTFTGVTTSISWNVSGKCSSAVYYAAVAPYRGDKPAGKIKNSKLHNIVC
ncbi:hypothetical protein NPS70_27200 [Streptomyces sp. C10-9-1]|nr:hypothetical protein [Streptomyces sp. C10-9-1]MCQ6556846.1 hypothetical protein [Streptomyces sp. C10-9-1]